MSAKSLVLALLVAGTVALALSAGPQAAGTVQAMPPTGTTLPYVGRLTDDAGQAVPDGAYDFTFALYNAPKGGHLLWSETQTGVAVRDGAFSTRLGSVEPIPAAVSSGPPWLAVSVRGPGETEFTALTPRQALAAPSAGPTSGGACPHDHWGETWSGTGSGLVLRGGSENHAVLYANDESQGGGYGVYGGSFEGYGVYGVGPIGVLGKTDFDFGVRGEATNNAGIGVVGYSLSGGGIGVKGVSTSWRGVWGESTSDVGVWGQSQSNTGVAGHSTSGVGVWGQSTSNNGVYAVSTSGTGVRGEVGGTANVVGVAGIANASGCAPGLNGCRGVQGSSEKGYGVEGWTNTGVALHGWIGGNGDGLVLETTGATGDLIRASWFIGADTKFRVDINGEVYADGTFHTPATGFAEMLTGTAGLEAGDVLVVAPQGFLTRCDAAYQPTVVGVYAPGAGFVSSAADADAADKDDRVPVAVMGFVLGKVSAENGPIVPGDLLVAAATPGHAMKSGANPPLGTVIGKALGRLDSGTGTLLMLVMLH